MTKSLVLDEVAMASLAAVIEYCWADELEDCQAQVDEGGNSDNHVFSHLVRLRNALDGTDRSPRSYLEPELKGADLCDMCMASGVNVNRTTPCGKTIGVECGCEAAHEDGLCENMDCDYCYPEQTGHKGLGE